MSDEAYKIPQFAFLAHPPPLPHKKRAAPDAPLPPTPPHRFATILTWAATVQPGSPAPLSPSSPRRRLSVSSTASPRRRRPSVASLLSLTQAQSTGAAARSPSVADKFDLTALGYTSVFVHLPKTPTTPSPLLRAYDLKHRTPAPAPAPTLEPAPKRKVMRRFRSLSILRPRAKQAKTETAAPSSTSPTQKPIKSSKPIAGVSPTATTPASAHSKAEICAATIAKRKRAKYAYVRPPPTLAQELAVMQFADGGKIESHIQRVMEEQARLAAGSRPGAQGGVADVYRDDKGGVWWDADEEMEYAHLLGGETVQDALKGNGGDVEMEWQWETFDAEAAEPLAPFLVHGGALRTAPLPTRSSIDNDRRSSISSVDSDLDPQYLLPLPENEDPRAAVDDRVLASRRIGGPGMSVLSLPSRPRRAALHLAKPASFLVGEAFSGASGSPTRPALENKENAQLAARPKPRGKARRRPAPLKLANSAHAGAVAAAATRRSSGHRARHHHHHQRGASAAHAAHAPAPTGALPPIPAPAPAPTPAPTLLTVPGCAAAVTANIPTPRREFIEDSFAPVPVPQSELLSYAPPPTPTPSQAPSKRSFRSVKGLFGLGRKMSAVA